MTKADFQKITIYKFRNADLAFSFADHAVKPMMVIPGDDDRYWVVLMADASRLIRAGYETAPRA